LLDHPYDIVPSVCKHTYPSPCLDTLLDIRQSDGVALEPRLGRSTYAAQALRSFELREGSANYNSIRDIHVQVEKRDFGHDPARLVTYPVTYYSLTTCPRALG